MLEGWQCTLPLTNPGDAGSKPLMVAGPKRGLPMELPMVFQWLVSRESVLCSSAAGSKQQHSAVMHQWPAMDSRCASALSTPLLGSSPNWSPIHEPTWVACAGMHDALYPRLLALKLVRPTLVYMSAGMIRAHPAHMMMGKRSRLKSASAGKATAAVKGRLPISA